MLERAKEVTRSGKYTYIEYARFADDLVILIDAYPQHDWLNAEILLHLPLTADPPGRKSHRLHQLRGRLGMQSPAALANRKKLLTPRARHAEHVAMTSGGGRPRSAANPSHSITMCGTAPSCPQEPGYLWANRGL